MAEIHESNGIRTCTSKEVLAKFKKKNTWLWERLKNDPEFPRPVYLSPGVPLWFESELDSYLIKLADRQRSKLAA